MLGNLAKHGSHIRKRKFGCSNVIRLIFGGMSILLASCVTRRSPTTRHANDVELALGKSDASWDTHRIDDSHVEFSSDAKGSNYISYPISSLRCNYRAASPAAGVHWKMSESMASDFNQRETGLAMAIWQHCGVFPYAVVVGHSRRLGRHALEVSRAHEFANVVAESLVSAGFDRSRVLTLSVGARCHQDEIVPGSPANDYVTVFYSAEIDERRRVMLWVSCHGQPTRISIEVNNEHP